MTVRLTVVVILTLGRAEYPRPLTKKATLQGSLFICEKIMVLNTQDAKTTYLLYGTNKILFQLKKYVTIAKLLKFKGLEYSSELILVVLLIGE